MAGGILLTALGLVGAEIGTIEEGLTPAVSPEVCVYADLDPRIRACFYSKLQGLKFDKIDLGGKVAARGPIADGPWFVGGSFSFDGALTGPRADSPLDFRPTLAIEAGTKLPNSPLSFVGGVSGAYVSIVDRFPGGSETVASQGNVSVFVGLEGEIPLWK